MEAAFDRTRYLQLGADVPEATPLAVRVTIAGRYAADDAYRCPPRTLRNEYVLIYTEAGRGRVRSVGTEVVAAAGEAFLLVPGVEHEYRTDGDAWRILWCHFTCDQLALRALGRAQWIPPIWCGAQPQVPGYLSCLIDELTERRPYFLTGASALAQLALLEVLRLGQPVQLDPTPRREPSIGELLSYVRAHLGARLKVEDLAAAFSISSRHLHRLFQQSLGESPQRYILRMKVAEARRLLLSTQLSVAAIAQRVGFADPYYFSRFFREKMGQSPSRYRRRASWQAESFGDSD